ncbi:hypothetical protein H7C18_00305 [Cohnella sp. CBP 2801]|uniref:Uncharacterized protein n=2 Tax=Cohnella zeiphila TaxID=2761120 RepID=A0A7X0VSX8_9BACL|nr:hypothetical protein [Cohnella zeiphila]
MPQVSPANMSPYHGYGTTQVSPANIGPSKVSPVSMGPCDCYGNQVSPAAAYPGMHGYGFGYPGGISPLSLGTIPPLGGLDDDFRVSDEKSQDAASEVSAVREEKPAKKPAAKAKIKAKPSSGGSRPRSKQSLPWVNR